MQLKSTDGTIRDVPDPAKCVLNPDPLYGKSIANDALPYWKFQKKMIIEFDKMIASQEIDSESKSGYK